MKYYSVRLFEILPTKSSDAEMQHTASAAGNVHHKNGTELSRFAASYYDKMQKLNGTVENRMLGQ